jgi:KaiC/GvpD/RAD55 family RecA-like ATPase
VNDEQIAHNLAMMENIGAFEHYRPLSQAADEFISWAINPEARVYTGITELDAAMRGTAPGELTLIQGFTHSGKTLLCTELMLNNPMTPLVLFTPDETRPLVLTKLTSALHGVGAEELERRIQADDESARQLLLTTAEKFGKLAIFDESVSVVDMDNMMAEVTKAFQLKPKGVVFDYAELLEGPDDVKAKMTALKAWGKRHQVAMFVIHQTSRTSGSGGKKMQIDSGSFGGEQQATHVIGVRRKKYMHLAMMALLEEKIANAVNPKSIEEYRSRIRQIETIDLPRDNNTVTVSLVKNKRPPCNLVDDIDYNIDQTTGRVSRIETIKDEYGNMVRVSKAAGLDYLRQRKQAELVQNAIDELGEF